MSWAEGILIYQLGIVTPFIIVQIRKWMENDDE